MQKDERSRSQIKREFRKLKELGVQLAGLSEGQLRGLPLSEDTLEAILVAKGLNRGALQRQYRYLSSLLAREDVAAVRLAVTGALQPHATAVASLHAAERWRDRLLQGDDSVLVSFSERYSECDLPHLRSLADKAKRERDLDKPPASARQLFRYVKQLAEKTHREDPPDTDD